MKGIKFGDDNNGRLSTVAVAAAGAYQVSLRVCMQVYVVISANGKLLVSSVSDVFAV